jgi:hypothetical protein
LPGRAAAVFPGIRQLLVGPRFGTFLSRSGYRPGAPQALAGFRVVAIDEAARRAVAAAMPEISTPLAMVGWTMPA